MLGFMVFEAMTFLGDNYAEISSFGLHITINSISNICKLQIFYFLCLNIVVRYDPINDSYHDDMEGNGVMCLAVDILPTEFAKEVGAFSYSNSFISIE